MEIRNKILFGALLLVALLSCTKDPDNSGDNGGGAPAVISGNIQGTVVSSTGAPLAGVVVSDGYNCTITNSEGRWGLESDLAKTDYVFVSTPSDHSAPLELLADDGSKGTPVFWKFLKDLNKGSDGKYMDVKFTLDKIQRPDVFSIIFYADPQPRSSSAGYDNIAYHSLDNCKDMYADMTECVSELKKERPMVYGIGLGDIVHRSLSLLPRHKNGMAGTGLRNYNVIGNHDHDVSKKTNDRDAARPFEAILGPVNYSFNIGDIHVLVLDNMIAPLKDGTISDECDDGLTDDIWQWMQNDLSYVSKDKTIIVCAHSPMFTQDSKTGAINARSNARHGGDYKLLLSGYKKVLHFAGHAHTSVNHVDVNNPKIEFHTVTRVTGELWTNEYMGSNGTPRGYIVFDYDSGKYKWHFKPIIYQTGSYVGLKQDDLKYTYRDWDYQEYGGKKGVAVLRSSKKPLDDSYQMQLFAPGLYGDGKYLYANVFLWDELWENPRFVKNGIPSKMTKVTTKDYKYSYSMKEIREFYKTNGSVLGSADYKFEANNTDSMFNVFVSDEHGSGKVTVKDRFGNEYSSEITW